jgi:hypothetical protein
VGVDRRERHRLQLLNKETVLDPLAFTALTTENPARPAVQRLARHRRVVQADCFDGELVNPGTA